MKKAGLFFLMLVFCISLLAQTQFNIKAGLNVSSIGGKDVDAGDFKRQAGYYFGGTINIPAGKQFSVQPELLFSNKGYRILELGGDFRSNFNFLALPVLVRYTTLSGFYAETGPSISFLLSAKRETDVVGYIDVKDAYKSTAFTWGAGIGYHFKSGLGIGTSYNIGLSSISNNSNFDIKFNVLRIGLDWTFGKKEKKEKEK